MQGWMCCNQWEQWGQWDAEDQRVARESLRARIRVLRSHRFGLHLGQRQRRPCRRPMCARTITRILDELHWQNPVVDTVSSFNKDASGKIFWNGIRMEGPYSWRPPTYWFSGRYKGTVGSCAEQGDNESIPTLRQPEEIYSGRQALAHQRLVVLSMPVRPTATIRWLISPKPWISATVPPAAPRSSLRRPRWRTTKIPGRSLKAMPPAAGAIIR